MLFFRERQRELKREAKSLLGKANVHHGANYACTVDELIWGPSPNLGSDGTFWLVVFDGSVEEGQTYLIGFNRVDENSFIHTVAAENAVFENTEENRNALIKAHDAIAE